MATGNPNVGRDPDYPLGWGCAWWWFLWLILLIIFFAGGWWWGGWYGPWYGPRNNWQGQQAAAPPAGQSVSPAPSQTAAAPAEFLGRTITISGKVDNVIDSHAFTLASTNGNGRDLLVVTPSSVTPNPAVKKGETVQVKGKVQRFDRNEFDSEGKVTLPENSVQTYAGRPAILANSVSETSGK